MMHLLIRRLVIGQLAITYAFTNGLLATMTDASGVSHCGYNVRNWLATKATPQGTLAHRIDELSPTGWPQVLEELTDTGSELQTSRVYAWGHGPVPRGIAPVSPVIEAQIAAGHWSF